MARAASFKLDITKWVEKAGDRADLIVRKVALDLARDVIFKTPVIYGRLRGAWTVGINRVPSTIGPPDKNGEPTRLRAETALLGAKAGDRIYIANNVEYAVFVEFGTSKMAPRAMVRTTIDEFQSAVHRAAAEAKKERP